MSQNSEHPRTAILCLYFPADVTTRPWTGSCELWTCKRCCCCQCLLMLRQHLVTR